MSIDKKEFEIVRSEFIEFLKKETVPPKMRGKLMLLAKRIKGEPIKPEEIGELDRDEIDQLEQLTEAGKISLFLSVTRCIMGKEELDFVIKKQAFVKKDAMFSFWNICYITYDSNSITITKKKPIELLLRNLKISSKVRKGRNKYSFILRTPQDHYKIGFLDQKIANDVYRKFRLLILGQNQAAFTNSLDTSLTETPSKAEETGDFANMEAMEEVEQEQYGQQLLQQYEALKLEDDSEYKLEKHLDSGRILRHQSKPNTFKAVVLVDVPSAEAVLNLYAQIKEWNTELTDSSIVTRIDEDTYVCYEKYKAYSLTSWARDFVVMKLALQHLNQIYLLEKSVEHQDVQASATMVRGNIVKKATVFLNKENCPGTLMITRMQVDFAGRNTREDNRNMAVQYLAAYDKFPKYCIEKSFLQTAQRLFSFKKLPTHRKQSEELCTQPTQRSSRKERRQSLELQRKPQPKVKKPFIELMQKYIEDDIPEEYFERLKAGEQNFHHLKHKFSTDKKPEGLRYDAVKDDFVFQGGDWVINENGQFIFVNKKAIEAQKDVIKYILKQIGSNLLAGKSVMNMSLPVEIFDSRSILQRSASSMGYTPSLFIPAGKSNDELEQIFAVITHVMSITLLELRIEKPFNPILGETFQGYIGGIPIYMEQTSHHPPISSVFMKCEEFTLYGGIILSVDMGLNSCTGCNSGIIHVQFPNGTHFEYIMPEGEVSGLVYGDRKFKLVNKGYVYDRARCLFAEISLGKDKEVYGVGKKKLGGCEFVGGVYKVTQEFMSKFLAEKKKSKWGGISKKDIVELLATIDGAWDGEIKFNNKVFRKLYEPAPHKLEYELYPLASSANYRQDILYRRLGNLAQSQISKEYLQNFQRADRKLRGSKH